MVRQLGAVCAMVLLSALPLAAEMRAIRSMETGDAAKDWLSVGRLLLGTRGFCSAALVAPDLVLTAAHCLYDSETSARIPDQAITFQSGWRNGRAEALRGVKRSLVPPRYVTSGGSKLERVGMDLALLQLDLPIRLPQLPPFAVASPNPSEGAVTVISYAAERSEAPSLEAACPVLAQDRAVMVLDCEIDFGASGAPVFALRDGIPVLIAVISAKADYKGQDAALAVVAAPLHRELLLQFDRSSLPAGVTGEGAGQSARPEMGAKFLRP